MERSVRGLVAFALAGLLLGVSTADGQTLTYTLTIESVPHGYVTARGIDCGAGRSDCQETFLPSDVIELRAVPLDGYYFLGWKGSTCVGGAVATVAMSYHRWCTPIFAANAGSGLPESHNLSERALFLDSELVGIGPPLPAGSKNRQVYLPGESAMTITSPRAEAFRFSVDSGFGFWGVTFAAERGQQLTVGAYDFISFEWTDGGEVAFHGPWSSTCGVVGNDFDVVTRESALVPSRFVVYELDVAGGALQRFAADFELRCSATVTVAGAIRYHSTRSTLLPFDGEYPAYRLMVDPTVGGAITGPGLDCGDGRPGPCRADYASPTVITLTAESFPGYEFMGWGGACKGSAATTQLTVNFGRKCFAAFIPIENAPADPSFSSAVWRVDFHRSGAPPVREFKWPQVAEVWNRGGFSEDGSGHVHSGWRVNTASPQTLREDLGRTIHMVFPSGQLHPGEYTEVYLATNGFAPALSMSDHWSNHPNPSFQSTAFICVTAVARIRVYEATVDAGGDLTSFAADFEALCRPGTYTYMVGAIRFNSTRTSLEPFDGNYPLFFLNVERPVNGRIVTSGIDCGAGPHTDCEESFSAVTDLTMQAIPGPGYEFVAWTGACKGASTMTFRVDWTRTCSALFEPVAPGFGVEDPRARNAFLLEGAPGNHIVTGRHLYLDKAVIAPPPFAVHPTWVVVQVTTPDRRVWAVKLRVPHDQVLRPGTFEARKFFSEPSAEPQLSVGIDYFFDCGRDLVGRFVIHEISFATVDGKLTLASLAVDFEQRCSPGAAPLSGSLRYNSTRLTVRPFVAPVMPPPPPQGDFDGDGWPDIAWRHRTNGRNAVWLMTGADAKATLMLSPGGAATLSDTNWEVRATGDFNGDARADLVWQHNTTGRFAVWFMSGATRISTSGFLTLSGASVETDMDWKIVAAGDFNRDTQTDLLWWNRASGALRVWHMSGLEQWDSVNLPITAADVAWQVGGIGDVNGDGWLDILWRHYGHGGLAVWFMRDTALVQTTRLTPDAIADVNWHLVGVADTNLDGQVDLLWQHYTDGRLGVWYMNGTERESTTLLNPGVLSDVNWRIVGFR